MKKQMLCLTLVLLCCLSPLGAIAEGDEDYDLSIPHYNPNIDISTGEYIDPLSDPPEDAPEDNGPHITPGDYDLNDPEYVYHTASAAQPLLELVAMQLIDGEPDDNDFAWGAMRDLLIQHEMRTGGALDYALTDELFLSASMATKAYDDLFAYDKVPPMPSDRFKGLSREDTGYRLDLTAVGPSVWVFINDAIRSEHGDIMVDATVMRKDEGQPTYQFARNLLIDLLPDSAAPFGAKISGYGMGTGKVEIDGADALAELANSGSLTYRAQNMLDGKLDTCWAYPQNENPGATASLFIQNDVEFTTRGISFTPGYAKSDTLYTANNRIKQVEIMLSTGEIFTAHIDAFESKDAWTTIWFDGLYTVSWIRMRVLDVYPGTHYDDTCISEAIVF